MLEAAAASASAAARFLLCMNINTSPAIIANPTSKAATAIPAIAPVLSPDEELCDTVTVPVADTAPVVPVIADDEVNMDEDVEKEVEEEGQKVAHLHCVPNDREHLLHCGVSDMVLTAVFLADWIVICRIRTPAKTVTGSIGYLLRKVTYRVDSALITGHTT